MVVTNIPYTNIQYLYRVEKIIPIMVLFVIFIQKAGMLSLIFVNIYIRLPAVWCLSHSSDYQMKELMENEPIIFQCTFYGLR